MKDLNCEIDKFIFCFDNCEKKLIYEKDSWYLQLSWMQHEDCGIINKTISLMDKVHYITYEKDEHQNHNKSIFDYYCNSCRRYLSTEQTDEIEVFLIKLKIEELTKQNLR